LNSTEWYSSNNAKTFARNDDDRPRPNIPDLPNYKFLQLCGEGGFGQVWLVKDITGKTMALKIVNKRALGNTWKKEFEGLEFYRQRITNHPNLIEIFHIEDRETFFYYTMEAADNLSLDRSYRPSRSYHPDTLENRLKRRRCSARETKAIAISLLNGIEALHAANLIHRDIKPPNIIFINGVPKLSDIGLVTAMSMTFSVAGTPGFIPPEEIINSVKGRSRTDNNFDIDLYALGKVIYCCFTGNSVESYPSIPEDLLNNTESAGLNKLIGMLCAPNRFKRVCSINILRKMLYGIFPRLTFMTLLYRYIIFSLQLMLNGILDFARYLRYSPRWVKYTISTAILLGLWFSWDILGAHYLYYNSPQNYIERKCQEYSRQISELGSSPDIDSITTEITKQSRNRKLAYSAVFDKVLKDWKQLITPEGNLDFQNEKFIAGALAHCDMRNKVSLPDDYEISFDAEYESMKATVRFSVCAAPGTQYDLSPGIKDIFLPRINNDDFPAQYEWGIDSEANFTDLRNTQIPRSNAAAGDSSKSLIQIKGLKSFYRFQIIKAANHLLVFCNGNLLYPPKNVYFKGGHFGIAIESTQENNLVVVKNLKVYDISPSNSTGDFFIPDAESYEKTDKEYQNDLAKGARAYIKENKLVPKQPRRAPEKTQYSWLTAQQATWDSKTLSLYSESDACLTQRLPADYEISFSFTSNTDSLVLRFLKNYPKNNSLDSLYYSYPAVSLVLTGNSISLFYHCAKNQKFEVATQKYSGNYNANSKGNKLVIKKFGGELSIRLGDHDVAHFNHGIFGGGFFSVYCHQAQDIKISNFTVCESKYELNDTIKRIISPEEMQYLTYNLSAIRYFDEKGHAYDFQKLNESVIKAWSSRHNISPHVVEFVVKYISQPIIQEQFLANSCFTVDSSKNCITSELEKIWTSLDNGETPLDIKAKINTKFNAEYDILDCDIAPLYKLTDVYIAESKTKIEKAKAEQEKAKAKAERARQLLVDQEELRWQQEVDKQEEAQKAQAEQQLREKQRIADTQTEDNEKSYTIDELILKNGSFMSNVLPYKFELSFDVTIKSTDEIKFDLFTIPNDDKSSHFLFSFENGKYSKLTYKNNTYDSFAMKYDIGKKINVKILHDGDIFQFLCDGKPLYPLMPGIFKGPGKFKITSNATGDSAKITNFKVNAITNAPITFMMPEACAIPQNTEEIPLMVPSLNAWQSRQEKHLDNQENIGWLNFTNSGALALAGPLMSQNSRNMTQGYMDLTSNLSRVIANASWPESYTLEFYVIMYSKDNQFMITLFNGSIGEINKSIYYLGDATEFYFIIANGEMGDLTYRKITNQKVETRIIEAPLNSLRLDGNPHRVEIVRNADTFTIYIDGRCQYYLQNELIRGTKLIPRLDFLTTSPSDIVTIARFKIR